MAAAPAPRSSVPWKPAVPPPPVTGAALGIEVADEVAVAVAVAFRVTVVAGRGVWVAVDLELTPGVPEVAVPLPGEGVLPALPEEAEDVADPLVEVATDGEKTVGVEGDDDEVHAVTATGASRVSAPQHRAVSLAPSVVPRPFMDPPHGLADDDLCFPLPAPGPAQ